MTDIREDVPKVSFASAAILPDQGGVELKLTTAEKVDVYFHLDDLALGLLQLTLNPILHDAFRRTQTEGQKPIIFLRKDADK